MTNETQPQEQKQPDVIHLVNPEVMQMIIGCLGEMKLKDTGGLYLRLLQCPQMDRQQLQDAVDAHQASLKQESKPEQKGKNAK